MSKSDWIVVSFSGGKDSTAMLLRMIELGEHIDEVVCCDTYKEFPAMYRHIEKVRRPWKMLRSSSPCCDPKRLLIIICLNIW